MILDIYNLFFGDIVSNWFFHKSQKSLVQIQNNCAQMKAAEAIMMMPAAIILVLIVEISVYLPLYSTASIIVVLFLSKEWIFPITTSSPAKFVNVVLSKT